MGLLLFLCFLPVVYPLVYSLIYNPELVKDVPMVVVDNDRTPPRGNSRARSTPATRHGCAAMPPIWNEARRAMAGRDCYAIPRFPRVSKGASAITPPRRPLCIATWDSCSGTGGFVVAATNVMMDMGAEILTQKNRHCAACRHGGRRRTCSPSPTSTWAISRRIRHLHHARHRGAHPQRSASSS